MCAISYVSAPQALSPHIFKKPFLIRLIIKFAIEHYIKNWVYTIRLLTNKKKNSRPACYGSITNCWIFKYAEILLP